MGLRYFLALTLDPFKLTEMEGKRQAVTYIRECFNEFRVYLKRFYGSAPSYMCVLEFTKAGIPHLHILFDRFISQAWISSVWDSLGGGRIVFIKRVTILKVLRYLSKYLTKELFLSAPKGTRRITTARAIKLFSKFNSGITCELLKESSRRNLLNRQLKPAAKALKLTGVNWHWFRHAQAPLLDSTGAPIGTTEALLGYSSSEITRETHIHSVPADARRALEDVARLLASRGSLLGPQMDPSSGLAGIWHFAT